MNTLQALLKRNIILFFKDKAMFFTAMITPLILLVLYITFLGNVYQDSFTAMIAPFEVQVSDQLLAGCVGGQLLSSLLSVCTVTVAFCSNMLTVQDIVTGAHGDLTITPVKPWTMAFGYWLASYFTTLIICLIATGACFGYLAYAGWYLSVGDVLYLLLDVVLLSLFGTALSGVVNFFLSTQGQISAVGSIVSSCYGFICGAYMPISSFSDGLQKVLTLLPGTYATSLLRNHALRGVLVQMETDGLPAEGIDALRDLLDCNIQFFDHTVEIPAMYGMVGGFALALTALYVVFHWMKMAKTK